MHSVEWVNSEEKPHSQPPPKAGSGRLAWKSKLTRYPLPNSDLPAPHTIHRERRPTQNRKSR